MVGIFLPLACINTLCRSSSRGTPCLRASLRSFIWWLTFGLGMSGLIAAFRALVACSKMFKKDEYGGSSFSSVRPPGFTALWWAGALSYVKNIHSRLGIRCRNSTSKSLKPSQFILPSWAVWCTRPFVGETARHKVTFLPRCPETWRYALSPTQALPQLLEVHTLQSHSSINTQLFITFSLMNQVVYSCLLSQWHRWDFAQQVLIWSFSLWQASYLGLSKRLCYGGVVCLVIFYVVLHLSTS